MPTTCSSWRDPEKTAQAEAAEEVEEAAEVEAAAEVEEAAEVEAAEVTMVHRRSRRAAAARASIPMTCLSKYLKFRRN